MKKVNFSGKLSLNKETISKLNNEQMNNIKGGEKARPLTFLSMCHQCTDPCRTLVGCVA